MKPDGGSHLRRKSINSATDISSICSGFLGLVGPTRTPDDHVTKSGWSGSPCFSTRNSYARSQFSGNESLMIASHFTCQYSILTFNCSFVGWMPVSRSARSIYRDKSGPCRTKMRLCQVISAASQRRCRSSRRTCGKLSFDRCRSGQGIRGADSPLGRSPGPSAGAAVLLFPWPFRPARGTNKAIVPLAICKGVHDGQKP